MSKEDSVKTVRSFALKYRASANGPRKAEWPRAMTEAALCHVWRYYASENREHAGLRPLFFRVVMEGA